MRKIGFGSFFIHLDSVLATFGACQQMSCVVDIGHTSINVNCVDEGLVVAGSNVKKHFGAQDLDFVLYGQLSKRKTIFNTFYNNSSSVPEKSINIEDPKDLEV